MDFPSYEDNRPFWFLHSSLLQKSISFVLLVFLLSGCITYTVKNFDDAIETITLSGNRVTTQPNQSYLILTVPKIKENQIFSVFFLEFTTKSKTALYSVDVDVSCRNLDFENNKRVYFQTNSTDCSAGSYRIFSTDYFHYDFFIVQVWFTGDISLIDDAQVKIMQSYPEFGNNEFKFRVIFSICSGFCLFCYIISIFLFSRRNTKFEQYITLFILFLGTFSNFLFSFTEHTKSNFIYHSIENLFRGAFPSFNLVSLYCITYLSNGGENVSIILTISTLFVLAEAMSEFTDDCCVIGKYFYGNYVVWIFFISASIISKASLSSLLIWNVIDFLFCGKMSKIKNKQGKKQFGIFIVYVILVFVQIIPIALQAIIFVNHNCGNNTFDFFQQYMIQTLFALVFAQIHWPVYTSKSEKITLNSLEFESEEIRLDVDALSAEVSAEVKSDNVSDHA